MIFGVSFPFSPHQIVSWNSESWEKQKSTSLQIPSGRSAAVLSDTQVQFHQDQTHFLVVHETQLSIYEVAELKCIKQVPKKENQILL